MRNTYFQFKQFRVDQAKCAMKVCTDSCLFGAHVEVQNSKRILDIGAGTGLLSLMVAQRSDAFVDAVEINAAAAEQAQENFTNSPWSDRLTLYHTSLQEFLKDNQQEYPVILSNPPFFLSSLRSGDAAKDTAKHTGELLFEDILHFTKAHLTKEGSLYLLLPPREAQYFANLAVSYGLFLQHTLAVDTYRGGQCIRHIQTYKFKAAEAPSIQIINIREADRITYSPAFTELLKPYYLNL